MLPIVQRELLVASRKWPTFWLRVMAALIAFFLVLLTLGVAPAAVAGPSIGGMLFHWLTFLAFWTCLFGGALLTADCLSAERREGTLGLLFLTDLKGYDVVLGKLVAKSLSALFCLLAIVPMLAIPILLGGITPGEFWRVVLVLVSTLFLSLAIGMVVSVFCKDARSTFAVAFFLVFIFACSGAAASSGNTLALAWHPLFATLLALQTNYAANPLHYIMAVTLTHVLAGLLLWLASWRVSRSWQTRPAQGRWLALQEWRRNFIQGNAEARLKLRRQLLNMNPVLWLQSRQRIMRGALFLFTLALAGGCLCLNFTRAFHWSDHAAPITFLVLLHVIMLMLISVEAGGQLVESWRDGAMELVLSTELNARDILRGHKLAVLRVFGPALAVMLVYDALWIAFVALHARDEEGMWFGTLFGICMMFTLVIDAYALMWCALYRGLRTRRPNAAAIRACVQIMVAPFLWLGLLIMGTGAPSAMVAVIAFTIVNLINAWLFGASAHQRAHEEFRERITGQPRATGRGYDEDYAPPK